MTLIRTNHLCLFTQQNDWQGFGRSGYFNYILVGYGLVWAKYASQNCAKTDHFLYVLYNLTEKPDKKVEIGEEPLTDSITCWLSFCCVWSIVLTMEYCDADWDTDQALPPMKSSQSRGENRLEKKSINTAPGTQGFTRHFHGHIGIA